MTEQELLNALNNIYRDPTAGELADPNAAPYITPETHRTANENMIAYIKGLLGLDILPFLSNFTATDVLHITLTGQSNATEIAENSEALAAEIKSYPKFKIWNATTQAYDDYDPTQIVTTSRHSFLLHLAWWFEQNVPTLTVYAANFAISGQGIANSLDDGSIYEPLYNEYYKPSVNTLINQGLTVNPIMILMQGEADSFGSAATFGTRLDSWVALWQGNTGTNLPIALTEIIETDANDIAINDEMASKATADSSVYVIDTDGAASNDDLHYNYLGFRNTVLVNFINTFLTQFSSMYTRSSIYEPSTPNNLQVVIDGSDATLTVDNSYFADTVTFGYKLSADPTFTYNTAVNGLTDTISSLPDGTYDFSCFGTNTAGNSKEAIEANVVIDTAVATPSILQDSTTWVLGSDNPSMNSVAGGNPLTQEAGWTAPIPAANHTLLPNAQNQGLKLPVDYAGVDQTLMFVTQTEAGVQAWLCGYFNAADGFASWYATTSAGVSALRVYNPEDNLSGTANNTSNSLEYILHIYTFRASEIQKWSIQVTGTIRTAIDSVSINLPPSTIIPLTVGNPDTIGTFTGAHQMAFVAALDRALDASEITDLRAEINAILNPRSITV